MHMYFWSNARAKFLNDVHTNWVFAIMTALRESGHSVGVNGDIQKGIVSIRNVGRFVIRHNPSHIQVSFQKLNKKGPIYDDGKNFEDDIVLYKGDHDVIPKFVVKRAVNLCDNAPVMKFGR